MARSEESKEQRRARARQRYAETLSSDPEFIAKRREYFRSYYRQNAESLKKKMAEYRASGKRPKQNADKAREYHLMKSYGITSADYDSMFAEQHGVCAACGTSSAKRLDVDHCHETGNVRGLLCNPCNIALGALKDSPERIMGLATYLLAHTDILSLSGGN